MKGSRLIGVAVGKSLARDDANVPEAVIELHEYVQELERDREELQRWKERSTGGTR